MNLTCFYCQTPFTLSMDQKIAALRKMHAENLHHYDAHCPRCGRANAISRERLEMFTPGWEEAIKEPAMAPQSSGTGGTPDRGQPNTVVPSPVPAMTEPEQRPAPKKAPARKRHAPAAKKATTKSSAKKAPAKKASAKKAPAKKSAKSAKKTPTKAKSKSSSKKTAKKSR
jgi:hypothetical protein